MDKKYGIGIDVGIAGVGWCVTDDYGRVIRNGHNHLMGTVKFDEANTAADRREKRARRRRMTRKKTRLKILQALLEKDVAKADPYFCDRLAESPLRPDDRTLENIYKSLPKSLFLDGTCPVRENARHLPIYAIRDALVKTKDKQADIRYVYLAIHHIFKSRGHFLDETMAIKTREDAEYAIQGVLQYLRDENGAALLITPDNIHSFLDGLENHTLTPEAACKLLEAGTRAAKALRAILSLMAGGEANAKDLFTYLPKNCPLSFEKLDTSEAYDVMSDTETDQVLQLHAVYSWINRREASVENKNISEKMTDLYRRHAEDLRLLKDWFRKYQSAEDYRNMFHNDMEHVSYNAYTASRTNPKEYTESAWNRCSQEVFYTRLAGIIRSCEDPAAAADGLIILNKMYDAEGNFIPNGFLPLQHISYNQRTPNREHLAELKKILDNQGQFYPTLRDNRDKLIALCSFYIPYFVGPLVQKAGVSPFKPWIAYTPLEGDPDDIKEYLKKNPVRPWNFGERIDLQTTAENYTTNLINRCTFMPQEKVLPKHSLLYEEFQLLEALNQLRIRYKVPMKTRTDDTPEQQEMPLDALADDAGSEEAIEKALDAELAENIAPVAVSNEEKRYKREYIPAAIRREIIDKFFYTKKRVRVEEIVKWMLDNYPEYRDKEDFCLAHNTGKMEGYFKISLQATHDMLRIFAPETPPQGTRRIDFVRKRAEALEKVILWSTVYKDRNIYKKRLWAELRDEFTDDELRQMERLRYEGWGRFCRRLLEEELCDYQGKKKSVIQIMRKNSLCFMQIYHRKDFGNLKNNIPKALTQEFDTGIPYDLLCERLHCSPALRRGVWTAIRVIQEIEGIMRRKPDNYILNGVYIRNQREANAGRAAERQISHARYSQIKKLYNNYEKLTGQAIDPVLRAELETCRTDMSDTQYLYFTQMGRCMYTGRKIDLKATATYIVDYIIPLGLLADTTLDNRVLILQDYNTRKYNQPMPMDIIQKMCAFWDVLHTHAFITYAKYNSLIKSEYTEDDLHYYLRRQWTETGLIMENLTRLLKEYYANRPGGSMVNVYGINAKLVTQFRNAGNNYYIKNLNDAQQAYDAFLTAHIGAFADKYFHSDLTNEDGIFRRELAKLERLGYQDKNGILVSLYNYNQPNEANYNPAVDKGLLDTLPPQHKYSSRLMRKWLNDREEAGETEMEASPWAGSAARWEYLRQVYGWHDGYVNYILKENSGQFYHERIYRPAETVRIPVKEAMDPRKYGGHTNAKTAYMAVIAYEEGKGEDKTTWKEVVNIPVYIAAKARRQPGIVLEYIREGLGFNEHSGQHNTRILKDKVMLHQEIVLDGHPYYMMSASELITAKQLYIRPEFIQTVWTATTMTLDNATVEEYLFREYLDEEMVNQTLEHLLDKLLYQYRIYPLLCRKVEENIESLKKISLLGKLRLIATMVNAMNTQSIRIKGALADIVSAENKADPGLNLSLAGDNRLNNRRIRTETDLILVNRSVTGVYKNETVL